MNRYRRLYKMLADNAWYTVEHSDYSVNIFNPIEEFPPDFCAFLSVFGLKGSIGDGKHSKTLLFEWETPNYQKDSDLWAVHKSELPDDGEEDFFGVKFKDILWFGFNVDFEIYGFYKHKNEYRIVTDDTRNDYKSFNDVLRWNLNGGQDGPYSF